MATAPKSPRYADRIVTSPPHAGNPAAAEWRQKNISAVQIAVVPHFGIQQDNFAEEVCHNGSTRPAAPPIPEISVCHRTKDHARGGPCDRTTPSGYDRNSHKPFF
jgi:hypothetical protein